MTRCCLSRFCAPALAADSARESTVTCTTARSGVTRISPIALAAIYGGGAAGDWVGWAVDSAGTARPAIAGTARMSRRTVASMGVMHGDITDGAHLHTRRQTRTT